MSIEECPHDRSRPSANIPPSYLMGSTMTLGSHLISS